MSSGVSSSCTLDLDDFCKFELCVRDKRGVKGRSEVEVEVDIEIEEEK